MRPFSIDAGPVVLSEVRTHDAAAVYEYCQDPVFEKFLTIPWPYLPQHAASFVDDFVPSGWASDREYVWALRRDEGAPLMGVISMRVGAGESIGFWLGAEHRGHGYMSTALSALADWAFANGRATLRWECLVGNVASLSVARKVGFTYTGVAPGTTPMRDGSRRMSWHGELSATDSREPKAGWPA